MVLIRDGSNPKGIILKAEHRDLFIDRIRFEKDYAVKIWRRSGKKIPIPAPYHDYMGGNSWRRRKIQYFETHNRKCVVCGSTRKIHLHHIVYSQRGKEKDKDLAAVCETCHGEFHKQFGVKGNMTAEWKEYVKDRRFNLSKSE